MVIMINAVQNLTKWGHMAYVANDALYVDVLSRGCIHEEDFISKMLHNIISRSTTIIDIGAHAGSHSLIYAKLNPKTVIFAFEPQKQQFSVLQHNIQLMSANNIATIRMALGNKDCDATLCGVLNDGPNAGVSIGAVVGTLIPVHLGGIQIGLGGEDVAMRRLDGIAPLLGIKDISFIRIDVSGFELFVLDGAYETIKKYKPVILIRLDHKQIEPDMDDYYVLPRMDSVTSLLQSMNYSLFHMEYNYLLAI